MKKNEKPKYLAIIYIGMGTSWATGLVDIDTAVSAVKYLKQDWSHLFKFKKKDAYPVHVHKLGEAGYNGWFSKHGIICDSETKKEIPIHKTFWVVN